MLNAQCKKDNPQTYDEFVNKFKPKKTTYERGYKFGIIPCHNGDLYVYQTGKTKISSKKYDMVVEKYRKRGYNSGDEYVEALRELASEYGINWRKV